jgi:hypothetical protein
MQKTGSGSSGISRELERKMRKEEGRAKGHAEDNEERTY